VRKKAEFLRFLPALQTTHIDAIALPVLSTQPSGFISAFKHESADVPDLHLNAHYEGSFPGCPLDAFSAAIVSDFLDREL
jgi:hypothetical protein